MANLNKVMLMGNLTRDPQLSYLPSQTAVCEVGLAVNRRWTGQDGQAKEETTFVDCSAFGKTAELLAKYLKKGRPVFIEGRLKYDQWEAQDGSKRSKLRVVVENFQFIDSRPAGSGGGGDGGEGGGEQQGGYQPRAPQQQQQPARAPYARPAGRPVAQAAPAPAPYPEAEQPAPPEDEAPPAIKDDDIPF